MMGAQRTPRAQRTQRAQRAQRTGNFFLCVLSVLCVLCATVGAQARRPRAEVTPVVETDTVRTGSAVHVALKVSLPEGLHTQSNKPRDPLLIPTVLTIEPPAGATINEIVFPPSTDLKQEGQAQPLAVFEQTFAIGAVLALPAGQGAGDIVIPAKLRYQACDANLCYAPATANIEWKLHVDAAAAAGGASDPLFATIKWGTGEKPGGNP